ncbi:hypothetical protein DFQ01_107120 [Paenibacillus cellulosilyticus]|uniref:Uncharacterized protein n=1 Tax=Paenibacillus cellulosilyticus TaxID=375489 RepID=A0A2V2YY15_9BACL|nr:hypothetical protein [Paenibacillus cellulosilyticus]PWW03223.1 hypothetical protein DFQ01_107120 [Paenibacillus cellulosilyticus]QKS43712.1 hypothetical protein HUB94_04130 [Paenibacillus cellulosilyticus]
MKLLSSKKIQMTLPSSNSKTYLELVDGRCEELHFSQVNPTKFTVNDSEFSFKTGATVELEIENVDLVATSQVLWPGQQVRVRGGVHGQGQPIKASATIPLGKKMADGVQADSFLYWVIETPEGTFHNNEPIHMKGRITGLPPKDATFHSEGTIAIFDEKEDRVGTLYGCLQSN